MKRKPAYTVLERLEFVKHLRIGDFHLAMSKTMKDLPALMPEITNTEDPGTYAYFLNFLGKSIPNNQSQIKKTQHYGNCYSFKGGYKFCIITF